MPAQNHGHLAEPRREGSVCAGQRRRELGEQPRATQAASPDDHAVAAGLGHHPHGVGGLEHVSVAQHRDLGDVFLQPRDVGPVRGARVALGGGARVQGHRGDTLGRGYATGVEEGVVLGVDAHPHLHRDR